MVGSLIPARKISKKNRNVTEIAAYCKATGQASFELPGTEIFSRCLNLTELPDGLT